MAERRCANCPPTPVKPKLPPVSGLVLEDGKRLWHHAAGHLQRGRGNDARLHASRRTGRRSQPSSTDGVTSFGSGPSLRGKQCECPSRTMSSLPLVSIILFTPKGEVTVTVDDSHYWVDIPLPEGVQEDEVDVYSCFLGPDHRPPFGCGPALLQAATRKPASAPAPAVEPAPVADRVHGTRACSGRRAGSGHRRRACDDRGGIGGRLRKHEVAQDERKLTERDAKRT